MPAKLPAGAWGARGLRFPDTSTAILRDDLLRPVAVLSHTQAKVSIWPGRRGAGRVGAVAPCPGPSAAAVLAQASASADQP